MKKFIFAIPVLAMLLFGCKKDEDVSPSKHVIHDTEMNPCRLTGPEYVSVLQDSLKLLLSWESVEGSTGYDIYRFSYTDYWNRLAAAHATDTTLWYEDIVIDVEDFTHYTKIGSCATTSFKDYSTVLYTEYYYKVVPTCERGAGTASYLAYGYAYTGYYPTDTTYYPSPGQEATLALFNELATLTGGEAYTCPGGQTIPSVVANIIQNHCTSGTDIVFLVDNTGSMGDDIDGVKTAINGLIDILPSNCMVGAAFYRDKNVDIGYWYGYSPLSSDLSQTKNYVADFYAGGGGDEPESVYDGLYNVINDIAWRQNSNRIVIVIGDAAPLTDPSATDHSVTDVQTLCANSSVHANLYPILTKYYNTSGSGMKTAAIPRRRGN